MLLILDNEIDNLTATESWDEVFRNYPNLYNVRLEINRGLERCVEQRCRIRRKIKDLEIDLSILDEES